MVSWILAGTRCLNRNKAAKFVQMMIKMKNKLSYLMPTRCIVNHQTNIEFYRVFLFVLISLILHFTSEAFAQFEFSREPRILNIPAKMPGKFVFFCFNLCLILIFNRMCRLDYIKNRSITSVFVLTIFSWFESFSQA